MRAPPIPEDITRHIGAILKDECGATLDGMDASAFVYHLSRGCTEYRFMGQLGFGGKFWNAHERWYVTCYREDETPERLAMIRRTNERLAALRADAVQGLVEAETAHVRTYGRNGRVPRVEG